MLDLFHKRFDLVRVGRHGFIGNAVHESGNTLLFKTFVQVFFQQRFQFFRHPDHAPQAAFSKEKLFRGQKHLAAAHESGGLQAAADIAGQRGEGHSARGLTQEFAVNRHYAVAFRHVGADHFKTAAAGHRTVHNGIGAETVHGLMAVGINVIVNAFPHTFYRINAFAFENRLVRPGLVNFISGFAVKPVVSAAEAETFRSDDTNMVRRE